MNVIDTTQIIDPNIQQPFLGTSLLFLQNIWSDMVKGIVEGLIGNSYSSTTPYAIEGIQPTGGTSTPSTITSGYIYWNHELIHCPGRPTPIVTGPVFNIVVSNPAPDPVNFSDGSSHSVHNVRTMTITDATPGSGLFNLSDVVYIQTLTVPTWTNLTLANSWTNSTTAKVRTLFGRVEILGIITNATLTNASLFMFTMPAQFRPAVDTYLSVNVLNNGNWYSRDVYVTASTGAFTLDTSGFSNVTTTVYLNGVVFYTG